MIAHSFLSAKTTGIAGAGASRFRRRIAALLIATALAPAFVPLLPDSQGRFGITLAQAQQSVAIDKIEIPFPLGSVVFSGITASNSSLGKAEIEQIFTGKDIKAKAELIKRLNADSLVIKSIDLIMKQSEIDQKTTYSTVEAKSIKAGLIDLLTIGEMRQSGGGKDKDNKLDFPYSMKTGKASVEKLDLAGIFSFLLDSDPTGKAPMKLLHGRYEVEPSQMTMGDMADIRVGKIAFAGFSARLPRKPLIDLLELIQKAEKAKGNKKASDEAGLEILARIVDVYSAIQIGDGQVDGIGIASKRENFSGTIGKIAFNGGKAPKAVMSDMDFKTPDGFFKLKTTSFEGDLYGTFFIALQQILAAAPQGGAGNPALEAELRQLVEQAAAVASTADVGFRLEGLDADLPPPKDGKTKERVKLSVASMHALAGKFVGYMPTKLDLGAKNFKMPVPADSRDQGIKTLRELGIATLDMSTGVKIAWDETTSRIAISELRAEIDKFARLNITGEVANVPRAVFENPQTNWPIAMMGGSVQKLAISLENLGGLEKLIEKTAKDQKKTPDQLRVEVSTMAPAIIGAFMSAHPDAQALSEAIGKFAKGLGAFSIAARGATPGGITAADVMAAGANPAMLLQKIRFEAQGR